MVMQFEAEDEPQHMFKFHCRSQSLCLLNRRRWLIARQDGLMIKGMHPVPAYLAESYVNRATCDSRGT
jgi:hypothetical protein